MDFKENNSSKNLTNLATWASLSVQIIGYFPLSSKSTSPGAGHSNQNSKTFKFTWTGSILPYYSSLLTAASFTWCLVYFLRYHEFQSFTESKSATEVAAYNLMIVTSTLSGIYAKIFALAKGKQYQKFWEYTTSLLTNFHVTRDLQKIGSSCRLDFFLMLIPISAHIIYFHVRPLLSSIMDDWISWTDTDTQLYLGLTFWSVFALLHVGNGIWLNFFVKVYTRCLNSIAIDLKNLSSRSQSNNGPTYKDPNDEDLSKLYADIHHNHQQQEKFRGRQFGSGYSTDLRMSLDKLNLVDREIARFNDFFGNMILLQVGNCVMNLLVFSFFACLWMGRGRWDYFAETLIPMYLYGKELLDMGTGAEELSAASEKVLNSIVEDIELAVVSEEMFLKIQFIVVQLCTKPPVVSARQFFFINRSLVTSVMSALATFLVVLVQFRDDEDASKAAAATKPTNSIKNATSISTAVTTTFIEAIMPTTSMP